MEPHLIIIEEIMVVGVNMVEIINIEYNVLKTLQMEYHTSPPEVD